MNDELTEEVTTIWENSPALRRYFTTMNDIHEEHGIEAALQYGTCEVLLAITREKYPEHPEGYLKGQLVDDLIEVLEMKHFDEILDGGMLTPEQKQLLGQIPLFGGFFGEPQIKINARIVKELRAIQSQSHH